MQCGICVSSSFSKISLSKFVRRVLAKCRLSLTSRQNVLITDELGDPCCRNRHGHLQFGDTARQVVQFQRLFRLSLLHSNVPLSRGILRINALPAVWVIDTGTAQQLQRESSALLRVYHLPGQKTDLLSGTTTLTRFKFVAG